MEYKIISSRSPEELTRKINEHISDGWKPVGSHSVVEVHRQNRYSGQQHMDTRIELEYSISMIKENTKTIDEAIEVIKTLREDAVMALDGDWDRTDRGFEDQIIMIDNFLNEQ